MVNSITSLVNIQEGFQQGHCTIRNYNNTRRCLSSKANIFLLDIDCQNAFGSINHLRLLGIMEELGYSTSPIRLMANIYINYTTTFIGQTFELLTPFPYTKAPSKEIPSVHNYLSYFYNHYYVGWIEIPWNTFGAFETHLTIVAYILIVHNESLNSIYCKHWSIYFTHTTNCLTIISIHAKPPSTNYCSAHRIM